MPDMMRSTRPVFTAEIICSKLVSCHSILTPSFWAIASPSSTSNPDSLLVAGSRRSSGG